MAKRWLTVAYDKEFTMGSTFNSGQRRTESRDEDERRRLDKALDVGLEETFPASDPVSVTPPSHAPEDQHHDKGKPRHGDRKPD